MGLIRGALTIIGLLLLAVVGLAAFLYFTDYAAEATVTDKGRDADGDYVILRPTIFPRDVKQHVDSQAAQFVCEGYAVTYHIQTQKYEVRDREGRTVYDSETGLASTFAPVRCALLGA